MSVPYEKMLGMSPETLETMYENLGYDLFTQEIGQTRKFSPPHLAAYLFKTHHIITMADNDEMYTYHKDSKVYLPGGDKRLRTELRDILGVGFKESIVKNILFHIRGLSTRDREDFRLSVDKIPVRNGILCLPINQYHGWNHNGEIRVLENSPEYFVFNRIPVSYNPEAQCPEWEKFVNSVLDPAQATVLQEYFGYGLFRDFHLHKALMLVGETRTGRSTTLHVLRSLLGEKNCSSVPLQDLQDKFERARIYNKLANIVPEELTTKAVKDTAKFNQLTGQDPVPARRLYQTGFEYVPFNIWAFAANKLPPIYHDEPAYWIRWILLRYTRKQYLPGDPETDTTLKQKFAQEMSGILNWALVGLRRVLKNGGFSYYLTWQQNKSLWNQMSDRMGAFLYCRELVTLGPDQWCTKDDFYEAYRAFCIMKNIPVMPKESIGREMNRRFKDTISTSRRKVGNEYQYGWSGVSIKIEDIEPPEGDRVEELFV